VCRSTRTQSLTVVACVKLQCIPCFYGCRCVSDGVCYIQNVHFPALLSALIRRQFRVEPAFFMMPVNLSIFFVLLCWKIFTAPGAKVTPSQESFPVINVGSGFIACIVLFLFFTLWKIIVLGRQHFVLPQIGTMYRNNVHVITRKAATCLIDK